MYPALGKYSEAARAFDSCHSEFYTGVVSMEPSIELKFHSYLLTIRPEEDCLRQYWMALHFCDPAKLCCQQDLSASVHESAVSLLSEQKK